MRITIIMMLMIFIMIINLLLTTRCFGKLQNWWRSGSYFWDNFSVLQWIKNYWTCGSSHDLSKHLKVCQIQIEPSLLIIKILPLVFWKAWKKPWECKRNDVFFCHVFFFGGLLFSWGEWKVGICEVTNTQSWLVWPSRYVQVMCRFSDTFGRMVGGGKVKGEVQLSSIVF